MSNLKAFLEQKTAQYNDPSFIEEDPIAIPHAFSKKQDIEITGFFAAIMAWGQRKTILNKCWELVEKMDHAPYDFIINHQEEDLSRFENFRHRTYMPTDILYFIRFFKHYYSKLPSLETAFKQPLNNKEENLEKGLIHFHDQFFCLPEAPARTRKHIATPLKKSSCKRLNMFLRWMVRKDEKGVDFGLWENISPCQLICPIDVHVARVARQLGLLKRKQVDWRSTLDLTEELKKFDPEDPVKYDFALFGLGKIENFKGHPVL